MSLSKIRRIEFLGSYFWLFFWTILFFPIAIVYFLCTCILIEEDIDAEEFVEWYRSAKQKKKA